MTLNNVKVTLVCLLGQVRSGEHGQLIELGSVHVLAGWVWLLWQSNRSCKIQSLRQKSLIRQYGVSLDWVGIYQLVGSTGPVKRMCFLPLCSQDFRAASHHLWWLLPLLYELSQKGFSDAPCNPSLSWMEYFLSGAAYYGAVQALWIMLVQVPPAGGGCRNTRACHCWFCSFPISVFQDEPSPPWSHNPGLYQLQHCGWMAGCHQDEPVQGELCQCWLHHLWRSISDDCRVSAQASSPKAQGKASVFQEHLVVIELVFIFTWCSFTFIEFVVFVNPLLVYSISAEQLCSVGSVLSPNCMSLSPEFISMLSHHMSPLWKRKPPQGSPKLQRGTNGGFRMASGSSPATQEHF